VEIKGKVPLTNTVEISLSLIYVFP